MARLDCDCYADAPKDLQLCQLHAAAPALLEALEAILVRFDENEAVGISTDEYEQVRAAIAQAKGESNG